MQLQRSLLFIPGSDLERIEAANGSVADVVVIDLEDGVAPHQKDTAREHALTALEWEWNVPVGVRVNGIDTTRGVADIEAMLTAEREPDFLAIPDVRGSGDLRIVADAVSGSDIGLMPLIEHPSAVFDVYDIAHTTGRIYGLLYAAIDFQMNIGMSVLGNSDLSLPRYLVSMAASAAGVPAFDKPLLIIDDPDALADELARAKALGYDGKLAVTPQQAETINEAFLPSNEELEQARRIIKTFETENEGLVQINGILVDKPVVEQLRTRLKMAEAAQADN